MPEPSNDMSEFVLSTAPINHIDYSKHNMEYTRVQKNNDKIVAKGGKEYLFFKRLFDIVSSSLFLILFVWFILLLMFMKFCENGHNQIYTSVRIGKGGKKFEFHKIRFMVPNADKMKKDPNKKGLNEADGPAFKIKDDSRITKFGKFLRGTSLDELPQVADVLVGNLSVICSRPQIPEKVEAYGTKALHRLDAKGGLLCYWQIQHNRNKLSFDEWVDLDLQYIENRSAALDMKILFKGICFAFADHSGE